MALNAALGVHCAFDALANRRHKPIKRVRLMFMASDQFGIQLWPRCALTWHLGRTPARFDRRCIGGRQRPRHSHACTVHFHQLQGERTVQRVIHCCRCRDICPTRNRHSWSGEQRIARCIDEVHRSVQFQWPPVVNDETEGQGSNVHPVERRCHASPQFLGNGRIEGIPPRDPLGPSGEGYFQRSGASHNVRGHCKLTIRRSGQCIHGTDEFQTIRSGIHDIR